MRRASWYPANAEYRRKSIAKCSVEVLPDYDRRYGHPPHQCPFNGIMWYLGRRYCIRHHPVGVAEREAWKLYKVIQTLESYGFQVTIRRQVPSV